MTRALPNYVGGSKFDQATPDGKFGLYLDAWDSDLRRSAKDKEDHVGRALNDVITVPKHSVDLVRALQIRQLALARLEPHAGGFNLLGVAAAPFITGLGNAHPLENGFAFLNPYGLPYLAGSGVKGVVRRAAEELASGEWGHSAWTQADVWSLFGIDGEEWEKTPPATTADVESFFAPFNQANTQTEISRDRQLSQIARELRTMSNAPDALYEFRGELHVRGLLSFWDSVPDCGDRLRIEIMTPHHAKYLSGKSSPHDSEEPTPIRFLSVKPGSTFLFTVTCDEARLSRLWPELAGRWKDLLAAAFAHAFDWLGFGAKTRVGYGAMVAGELPAPPLPPETPEGKLLREFALELQAQSTKNYQPGQTTLDSLRNQLLRDVPGWTLVNQREEAVRLLLDAMKYTSSKKDKKAALLAKIQELQIKSE